jgi:nitrite reductase/ring-hydroxylating ferredoxin subunit
VSGAAPAERTVFACSLAQLIGGRVVTVRLSPDREGRPREALVLCDAQQHPRAYLNLCRHLPVPLDAASREFLADGYLQCATHGARYRVEDGLCITGPCRGTSLIAIALHQEGHDLYVLEPPA